MRDRDGAMFQKACAKALHWMQEDSEVEVRTEQVQAIPSPICQELRELQAQTAVLTEELQTTL